MHFHTVNYNGDDVTIIHGSALKALEGDISDIGEAALTDYLAVLDTLIFLSL